MVCSDCGKVLRDRDQLKSDPTQELTINCYQLNHGIIVPSSVRKNIYTESVSLTASKRMAKEILETLVSHFRFNSQMREEALQKFNEIVFHPKFNCKSTTSKAMIAGVCIYLVSVKEKNPVTFAHVSQAIGCDVNELGNVYTQVLLEFPSFKPDVIPIEHLVPATLNGAHFEEQERIKLYERVIQLICVQRECCLVEGRSPLHIITAAAFVAWKSLKPYERRKVKLTQFCAKVGIKLKNTTSERVAELLQALMILAAKIPGKEDIKITKDKIALYVDDVLSHRHSLFYDLHQCISEKNSSDDHNPSITNELMKTFKRNAGHKKNQDESNCVKVEETSRQEDAQEISDSEIDSYIRKPQEIKILKKLKKIYDAQSEDPGGSNQRSSHSRKRPRTR